MTRESSENRVDETLQMGWRFLAGAIGGAIGFTIGGASGAVLGNTLPSVLEEVSSRLLGKRERERIGAVYILTRQRLEEYASTGINLRQDGFFDDVPEDGRAAAEEIVEAILTTAQHEYEEWKIPHYANLMAAIAVRPDISRSRAAHLIKTAQSLSMTQLVLLAIANEPTTTQSLHATDYQAAGVSVDSPLASLLSEMAELDRQNLITFSSNFTIGITSINPSAMRLEGDGYVLHSAMKLEQISQSRREEVKRILT